MADQIQGSNNKESALDQSGTDKGRPGQFPVVGVGASAGGLEAFSELLTSLPPSTGMAFVLVQHLDPRHESILADLLSNKTKMSVRQVENETAVEPDHVYVIPPNSSMVIENRTLRLNPRVSGSAEHYPIDTFFTSLAQDLSLDAIGVVLSGTASDGTLGLKAIKNEGGITFAQDRTAKFDGMPRSAISAGVVDFVLSPQRIAQELTIVAFHPRLPGAVERDVIEAAPALQRVMKLLRGSTGVDFSQYKPPTIMRRLSRRMLVRKAQRLEQYAEVLQNDPTEIKTLFEDLLISVTDFFRDPAVFEALQKKAFPEIIKGRKSSETIRVWVPGCSTGEEVYSLAIALTEELEAENQEIAMQLFGTDVSEIAIERARAAVYPESSLSNVSPERRRRFFERSDLGYRINRLIREMCIFSRHNLAKDPPLSRMDLISCRNLLIYFAPPLQRRVLSTFAYALQPHGCLILGLSESLGTLTDLFTPADDEHKIFFRKDNIQLSALELAERISGYTGPEFTMPEDLREELLHVKREAPQAEQQAPQPQQQASQPATAEEAAAQDMPGRIAQLETQLSSNREYLQSVIEELRSTNEEAQSANEELQSTNEELQTAKEELQSSNEELSTVNAELQSRNEQLSVINDDLVNLLSSMNMPIIMLGNDLCIRRFTPVAAKVLHLIPTDVGRPISDLKPRINVLNLEEILTNVMETLAMDEREVQDQEGRWYLMRTRPYRTSDNRIDGAVMQLLDVSDLKKSLDEVRQARDYAQTIVDTVREPLVVLDSDFNIQNANSAFQEFAELPAAATNGHPIFGIPRRKLETPEVRDMLSKVLKGGGPDTGDVEIEYSLDGAKRVMSLNARHLKDHGSQDRILLAFEDITARKRQAEARYQRLFESARDGIVIIDANTGEVTDANPFVEQLSGYRRDELVGRRLWELEALRNQPDIRKALEQLKDRGTVSYPEVTIQTKDGRTLLTEVNATGYTDGAKHSIQLNIRDLTARKKFERELRDTQKLESLGLLAGGIAHDFNNLLTGILGNTSLVYAETPIASPSRRYLRDVLTASERAALLTKQLLAYSGQGRVSTQNLNVGELAREILPLIENSVPRSVELRMKTAPELPVVSGDASQIQQVVANLAINGAEAIGEGKPGHVEVEVDALEVDQEELKHALLGEDLPAGTYVRLCVTDDGAGMDDAAKARIFDPFYTTKFTGRGLGLAAVLGIVRAHKGAIRVFSSPGQGSTFQVLLPAARKPPVQPTAEEKPKEHFEGMALIINGEGLAAEVLSNRGFETLTAHNAEAGFKLLRQHKDQIKFALLNVRTPAEDVKTMARILEISPKVPVIITSPESKAEIMRVFGKMKPAAVLHKPYKAAELVSMVVKVLPPAS